MRVFPTALGGWSALGFAALTACLVGCSEEAGPSGTETKSATAVAASPVMRRSGEVISADAYDAAATPTPISMGMPGMGGAEILVGLERFLVDCSG
jgi:hypothetical protein